MHLIDVAVPEFIASPPPEGTHPVELPDQCIVENEVISSDSEQGEETIRVLEVINLEEDFEVFDRSNPVESPITSLRPLPSA